MNILITGATGFIGHSLIRQLGVNHKITAIVRGINKSLPSHVEQVPLQVKDLESHDFSINQWDAVVHLAYERRDLRENFRMLKSVLSFAKGQNVKNFVFLSSAAVLDPHASSVTSVGGDYSKVGDPYSRTKILLEKYLLKKYAQLSLNLTILRPSIVFGDGGNWTKVASVRAKSQEIHLPSCDGKAEGVCNLIHVDDLANIICRVCSFLPESKVKIYNISAFNISWSAFYSAHALKEKLPHYKIYPIADRYYSSSLAKNIIYSLLYTVFGYFILCTLAPILKKHKTLPQSRGDLAPIVFTPNGAERLLHASQLVINSDKLWDDIGFKPLIKKL